MPRSTGDPMFDEMLGGGVAEGRTLLLSGPPGIGKSRLAVQFLDAGGDEDCLYLTTDEPLAVVSERFESTATDDRTVAIATPADDATGVTYVTDEETETLSFESLIERLTEPGWDRIVVDGVDGLVGLGPDAAKSRRRLFEFVSRVADTDATAVLTGCDDCDVAVDRLAHTVVDLWYEEIEGDTREFVRVRKHRDGRHDTRRHALAHDDDGIAVAAREWATFERSFRSGIASFDELAGGFVRGGTTVFQYEGTADHWPFTASLCVRAIEDEIPVVLIAAPGTVLNRIQPLLEDRVGTVRELMADDLLYLIDPVSREASVPALANLPTENVTLTEEAGSLQEAIRNLIAELAPNVKAAVSVFEAAAVEHLVSENQARQLFYWASGNVMALEDLSLVLTVDEAVAGTQLANFFAGPADQVVRTWRGSDELQYLSVPKSPAGTPGHTRVVEPLEEEPYVRLR